MHAFLREIGELFVCTDQHNDPHSVVHKEEGAETDHSPAHSLVVARGLQTHQFTAVMHDAVSGHGKAQSQ